MSDEIHIGGANYGPIATGKSRASQRDVTINHVGNSGAGQPEAVLASLTTLRQLVEQNAALIPELARVRKDLAAIESETQDDHTDVDSMKDAIRRIIGRVGMVGTVLAAANDLRDLIQNLVH